MLSNIGTTELIIILVLLLLFFGSKKLTELGRGMGEATKEIKKIKNEITDDNPDNNK